MEIVFRNDYHRTIARTYTKDGYISQDQINRIRRRLCPLHTCSCGGILNEMGHNPKYKYIKNKFGIESLTLY